MTCSRRNLPSECYLDGARFVPPQMLPLLFCLIHVVREHVETVNSVTDFPKLQKLERPKQFYPDFRGKNAGENI